MNKLGNEKPLRKDANPPKKITLDELFERSRYTPDQKHVQLMHDIIIRVFQEAEDAAKNTLDRYEQESPDVPFCGYLKGRIDANKELQETVTKIKTQFIKELNNGKNEVEG